MNQATKKQSIPVRRKKQLLFTTSVIVAFCIVALTAMSFAKLAVEVRDQDTLPFDRWVLLNINHHASPFLDAVIPVATDAGGVIGIIVFTAIVLLLFARKREYARIGFFAICVGGAVVLNLILKSIFERQRPSLWTQLVHETGFSFPSGHSMASSAFAFALIVVCWHTKWRWLAVGLGLAYMFFVGFTRLYLGVHYPTDVLGGWLVSAVWVLVVALLAYSSFGRQMFSRMWHKRS